jgi:hypothetical protein
MLALNCVWIFEDDESLYRSDSDESLRQYRLSHQASSSLRPQSTLSLNQLCSRRRSNPDIYPGARRFSTSYSHEDILSNDQLDQIHFDPRYRDYRSASSLNYRSRSNSLNSAGSGGNLIQQYQQFRRLSSHSPPLLAPLAPQKRWDTNPSIFIEEYNEEEHVKSKTESKSESKSDSKRNSKDTLCSSNESLQPLSEGDIKSFGDLSQIPFIDEDSNESAPCRFPDDECERKTCGIMSSGAQRNTCRKTVSFDVIMEGSTSQHRHLFTNNGKNSPKPPNSNPYSTDKNPLFYGSHQLNRANVRATRDGINRHTQSHTSVPNSSSSSSSCDDHCTLVDKLIRLKREEKGNVRQKLVSAKLGCKGRWDGGDKSNVCEGKVKALTTYFNSLPYMSDECNCISIHHSTPDLSVSCPGDRLSIAEMEDVRRQLKEWSEFGLKKSPQDKLACTFFEHSSPSTLLKACSRENEQINACKYHPDERKKLDKVEQRHKKNFHNSFGNLEDMYSPKCFCHHQRHHHCHLACCNEEEPANRVKPLPMRSEKHKCRSACFNTKDPEKKRLKKELKALRAAQDDNESFVI